MSADNFQTRKRGRPTGKNRVPLTAEQRRERNAGYERERRVDMAAALADLTDAAGCSNDVSNGELLAVVSKMIKKSKKTKHRTTDQLKAQNMEIMDEIARLEKQINIDRLKDWLLQPGGSPPRLIQQD